MDGANMRAAPALAPTKKATKSSEGSIATVTTARPKARMAGATRFAMS